MFSTMEELTHPYRTSMQENTINSCMRIACAPTLMFHPSLTTLLPTISLSGRSAESSVDKGPSRSTHSFNVGMLTECTNRKEPFFPPMIYFCMKISTLWDSNSGTASGWRDSVLRQWFASISLIWVLVPVEKVKTHSLTTRGMKPWACTH